jgi:hypothetical protein
MINEAIEVYEKASELGKTAQRSPGRLQANAVRL